MTDLCELRRSSLLITTVARQCSAAAPYGLRILKLLHRYCFIDHIRVVVPPLVASGTLQQQQLAAEQQHV